MKYFLILVFSLLLFSCKPEKSKEEKERVVAITAKNIQYAKGFTIKKLASGITLINITSPWPNAKNAFTYALVPKEKTAFIPLNKDNYDAIITVPVEKIVVTSTTHIPVLEALQVEHTLIGFPDTEYISSPKTRALIKSGQIKELGNNESINTEMLLALQPELVVGFSIDSQNKTYETIQRSNIPVVYNGDWTEETPLGKAEWIKFFAPFFGLEEKGDLIFSEIETAYTSAKKLASKATHSPTVISGAIYKDVWYLPGGNSWAAQFLKDANATYIFKDTKENGSLSLSWESVLEKGKTADYWVSPSQFTSYAAMAESSPHYTQFDAFKSKKIFTFAGTVGETGGLLYYELAPNRPDLVLKDLIHILHPDVLTDYKPVFFKPLK